MLSLALVFFRLNAISRLLYSSYRLSPEHVFPAGLDDCVTATKYFMENAERFGVDKGRVAIAGNNTTSHGGTFVLYH